MFPMNARMPWVNTFFGGFRIDQDVKDGCKQDPGECIGNDLDYIEQGDGFAVEAAVFDGELGSEYAHENTEQGIREHPAPVNASVENSIT